MRRKLVFGLTLFALVGLVAIAARAVTPSAIPQAKYGSVTVGASCGGGHAAVKIPASLLNRNTIAVFNYDAADIFCGWDDSVTSTTGLPVLAKTLTSFDVSYAQTGVAGALATAASATGTYQVTLYCCSTAGTAALAVRWMETR